MKNLLYIPFLLLMAITYTRLSENITKESSAQISRAPAAVDVFPLVECTDLPKHFNQHYLSAKCFYDL